jgi:hypothetical protein
LLKVDIRRWCAGLHWVAIRVSLYQHLSMLLINERNSVAEMQAFLVELVDNFEFSMTNSAAKVRRDICLVVVPVVEGEAEKGIHLPLRVALAERE